MDGFLAGEVGKRLRECGSVVVLAALKAAEPEADASLERRRPLLDAAGVSEEVRQRMRALWIASAAMYRQPLDSPLRHALAEILRGREMQPKDLLADEGYRRFLQAEREDPAVREEMRRAMRELWRERAR